MVERTRPVSLRHLFVAVFCFVISPLLHAEVDQKWLAVFEQSYGTEGLYVIEYKPTDPAASSRLALQKINAAAQQYMLTKKGRIPTFEDLVEGTFVTDIEPQENEVFAWDREREIFSSSLGGDHTPWAGTVFLIQGNEQIRRRLFNPDRFTRQRWGKIYQDKESPEFIRQEILLREFMIEHYFFPEVLLYERTQNQLRQIEKAIQLYGLMNKLESDATVTFEDLRESAMFGSLGYVPDNVEFAITTIGEPPTGTINGVPITMDPSYLQTLRKNRAKKQLELQPEFPPALALMARFEKPGDGILLLNKAIRTWSDVPGLRVERLALEGRRKNFGAWTKDLDEILTKFPAAPLLIEIEMAAEISGLSQQPDIHNKIALLLSDARPDLLTQQLWALKVLEKSNSIEDALTVYERLVYANPAWGIVLNKPGMSKPSPTEETISPNP